MMMSPFGALMHAAGLGMNKNWGEAARWFERGAAQGDAGAQYHLGVHCHRTSMLNDGGPVRESRIEAYKWFTLAFNQGDRKAGKNRDTVLSRMSPDELEKGEQKVREFRSGSSAPNE